MKLQEKGEKMKSINESCLERNQKQKESKTLSHLDRKSKESILQAKNTRV